VDGAIEAAGVGEAATLGEAAAVATGVPVNDGAGALTLGVLAGRTLGEAETAGVALAAVVAGVALATATVGEGLVFAIVGLGLAVAGVALAVAVAAVGLAIAGVEVAAGVAGVVDAVAVSTGFTNFFGGAFGGGVASARNLVRARSTAERSLISVQPLSTFTSTTRSFTRRGLKIFRTALRTGTETSSSSPRTLACASVLRSRRKR
jgi:hypothetical protein